MAKLFYVVGASGAGKDSLLRYARENRPASSPVVFAHRYITRPAMAGGENHVELSNSEFDTRLEHGCFAMHWRSHGLQYGIGNEILDWMNAGLNVVMNGSRAYLDTAAKAFSELAPVLIQVEPGVLHQRLFKRGRESASDISARLRLAASQNDIDHPALVRIDNNKELESAGNALLKLVSGVNA
jgi:ribose 1,5-bisphosphokinase